MLRLSTLAVALALYAAPALAGSADPLKVALIVSLDPATINVPTVELYRAVVDAAGQAGAWRAGSPADVKRSLAAPAALKQLGAIPAFDRKALVKSRAAGKRMIPSVQAMLDTLALDGAVIVDCAPAGTGAVKKCGLYYYDRSLGKVMAATQKSFRIRITDATRWAPGLLAGLSGGLAAYQTELERQRLNKVIADTSEEKESRTLTAELDLVGTNRAEPRARVTTLPGALLVLGTEGRGFASGLELGMGRAETSGGLDRVTLSDRSAGLFVSAQAHALEAMIWDLTLGAGYAETEAQSRGHADGVGDVTGGIKAKSIKLRLSPGLLWQISKSFQWGAMVSAERLIPLEQTASGVYAGDTIAKTALGVGIRLRSTF